MERRETHLAENPLDIFLCLFPRIKNETPFPRVTCMADAGTLNMECLLPRVSCITQSL